MSDKEDIHKLLSEMSPMMKSLRLAGGEVAGEVGLLLFGPFLRLSSDSEWMADKTAISLKESKLDTYFESLRERFDENLGIELNDQDLINTIKAVDRFWHAYYQTPDPIFPNRRPRETNLGPIEDMNPRDPVDIKRFKKVIKGSNEPSDTHLEWRKEEYLNRFARILSLSGVNLHLSQKSGILKSVSSMYELLDSPEMRVKRKRAIVLREGKNDPTVDLPLDELIDLYFYAKKTDAETLAIDLELYEMIKARENGV